MRPQRVAQSALRIGGFWDGFHSNPSVSLKFSPKFGKKNKTKNKRTLWGRRDSKPEISPMLNCSYLKLYWSSAMFNMLHSTTVLKQERFELPLKATVDDQEGEVTEIDERVIFCDCSILLMTIDAERDSIFNQTEQRTALRAFITVNRMQTVNRVSVCID